MVGLFFLRKPKPKPPAEPAPLAPEPEIEPPFGQTVYRPLAVRHYVDDTPDGLPGVPDLYAILGVDPHASDDTIRYTYRRKAAGLHERRWRAGRAVRQLAELNAAYEVLSKPDRRVDYDRRRVRQGGLEPSQNGAGGHPTGAHPIASGRGLPSGQRHRARRLRLSRGGGLIEVAVIVTAVALALYVAAAVLMSRPLIDLSGIVEAGEALGVSPRRRAGATSGPSATPTPSRTPVVEASPAASGARLSVPALLTPTPRAEPN